MQPVPSPVAKVLKLIKKKIKNDPSQCLNRIQNVCFLFHVNFCVSLQSKLHSSGLVFNEEGKEPVASLSVFLGNSPGNKWNRAY
jgi:hypothetical protein